jgi:hypothetical protein
MTTSERLAWWKAYVTVLALLGGLCLAHFAPLPFAWRIGAQLAILLGVYIQLWCSTGDRAAARTAPRGGRPDLNGEVTRLVHHIQG